jgi:hypothetical protein
VTQTVPAAEKAAPRHVSRRRRRGRRGLLVAAAVGVLLVAAFAVFAAWLGKGLLASSREVQAKAAVAQAELQQFRDTLKAGDRDAAKAHLAAGRAALGDAREAADVREVRLAKNLPYVGNTVSDLDHLLAAAGIMTVSADDALRVYEDFAGTDSKLFQNKRFSMPAITDAQQAVARIESAMNRAERELEAVEGKGPKGDEALAKKRSALAQVTALRGELVALGPVLEALPSAVGGNGRRTYLVAILNPAESRAPGGAPLSVAFVRFDKGRMSIPIQGQTSVLTNTNQKLMWTPAKGDPWVQGAVPRAFVNANVNPDFPVAAEQMLRAARPNFGFKPDGVVALDVVAISHLLRHTGPISSAAYGELTADNVVQKLLVDAYSQQQNPEERHGANDDLMVTMMSRLTEGGGMIGKARALGEAVPGRHLQMYFRDARLQGLISDERAAGEVRAPEVGNLTAVYTQNGNASKVDVFQKRTVQETVRLRADGSATVRRTVVLHNDTPPYVGVGRDPRSGYITRWASLKVLNLMPPGAKVTRDPAVARSHLLRRGVDQDKRPFSEAIIRLAPGSKASLTWEYTVPRAARKDGDGLRFLDYLETQPLLNQQRLQLTVVAPKGWAAEGLSGGWKVSGGRATLAAPIVGGQVVKVRVTPAG